MPDPGPRPSDAARSEAAARAARQRFFAIGLFRLSGAIIVMIGFLIMLEKFSWVSGRKAEIMGAIVASVGMVQFIIVPRLLLRAFASSRDDRRA